MATLNQAKEHVIYNILQVIIDAAASNENSYFYNETFQLDLQKYRKIVSDQGRIITGTNPDSKRTIFTKQDYQNVNLEFDEFVRLAALCLYTDPGLGRNGFVIPDAEDETHSWDLKYDAESAVWPGVGADGIVSADPELWYVTKFIHIEYVTTDCAGNATPETRIFPLNNNVLKFLSQLFIL